jgi:hypothetical protein
LTGNGQRTALCLLPFPVDFAATNFGSAETETTASLALTVFGWKRQRVDGAQADRSTDRRSVDDLQIFGWWEPTVLAMSTVVIRRGTSR